MPSTPKPLSKPSPVFPSRQQVDDVAVTFVAQLRLQRVADALDVGAILLRKIEVFERGVQLHEARADPPVERLGPDAHFCLAREGRKQM